MMPSNLLADSLIHTYLHTYLPTYLLTSYLLGNTGTDDDGRVNLMDNLRAGAELVGEVKQQFQSQSTILQAHPIQPVHTRTLYMLYMTDLPRHTHYTGLPFDQG